MEQQEAGGGGDLQQQVISGKEEGLVLATWDCGSPLYDSFELASLHRVLESHLMVLPFPGDDAASRSRRLERRGGSGTAPPPPHETSNRSAVRRWRKVGRWRGSKAAAAVFRAVTCWGKL